VQGILVPGASGTGIEGKIAAITFAREELIPFFGICLGCSARSSSSPAPCAGWPAPTAASST